MYKKTFCFCCAVVFVLISRQYCGVASTYHGIVVILSHESYAYIYLSVQ
jgi:hypothetical protein